MLRLNLNPTEKHLADIEKWLNDEWIKTNTGFYSNWDMIPNAFRENRLSVITEDNCAIGFVVYKIFELTTEIDIAEIKSTEREKGVARKLINETLDYFKSKGKLATQLFCSPENSELFWLKMGFLNFPSFYRNSEINMYKLLVDTIPMSTDLSLKTAIKLWNEPARRAQKKDPNWIWPLSFSQDNKTLSKPVIFPAENDWQIEFTKNGKTQFKDELKYFNEKIIDFGDFMIIRELNIYKAQPLKF